MRKIILSLLLTILLGSTAFAQGIYLPVASGTVTQANMKISAVDGTSFIDFTAANVLTGKTGNLLVVRDSSGRAIQGFIKAAGSGETLGSELITNWNFTSDLSGWGLSAGSGTIVWDSGVIKYTQPSPSTQQFASQQISTIDKAVYSAQVTVVAADTIYSNIYIGLATMLSNVRMSAYLGTSGTSSISFTSPQSNVWANLRYYGLALTTSKLDDFSIKQILTPSTTGVTITSTKGGTTFNWAQKNSAFNYNDASGYTYQIYKVLNAPVVDSDACTNANATINLTAGSAAWSCTGIDDAAYQDGKHIIAVYDTAGVAAFGYYKASGSGAVVNTKSGSTQNWISIGAGFSTAANYTRKVLYVGD